MRFSTYILSFIVFIVGPYSLHLERIIYIIKLHEHVVYTHCAEFID